MKQVVTGESPDEFYARLEPEPVDGTDQELPIVYPPFNPTGDQK